MKDDDIFYRITMGCLALAALCLSAAALRFACLIVMRP